MFRLRTIQTDTVCVFNLAHEGFQTGTFGAAKDGLEIEDVQVKRSNSKS